MTEEIETIQVGDFIYSCGAFAKVTAIGRDCYLAIQEPGNYEVRYLKTKCRRFNQKVNIHKIMIGHTEVSIPMKEGGKRINSSFIAMRALLGIRENSQDVAVLNAIDMLVKILEQTDAN